MAIAVVGSCPTHFLYVATPVIYNVRVEKGVGGFWVLVGSGKVGM